MLNDPTQKSIARIPRSIVQVGGGTFHSDGSADVTSIPLPMSGWLEWSVENNAFNAADTFSISFAISGLPENRKEDWFAQQQEINIEIFAGFPDDPENFDSSKLQSLIYGLVDEIDFDPVARTIHLSGRDLTAKLIDSKSTVPWMNHTSSDVAKTLADKYGLNAKITLTTKIAGNYYRLVNVYMQDEHSDWDLLCYLAGLEQFVVYVAGHDLHFEPAPADAQANTYTLQWQNNPFVFNGTSLKFMRGLTLAKGAQVTIKSFHQRGKIVSTKYPDSAPSNAQQYNYTFANLTHEQAYQKALMLHGEITRHEVKMSASLPADNLLSTANIIQVVGTGTAYDQKYYPDSISRSMSFNGGYTMNVSAKNHSPQAEVKT